LRNTGFVHRSPVCSRTGGSMGRSM
jgi:hypothetical protein